MSISKPPLPELSVLAARDPSVTNSDEWPEYRLNDALITLPSSSKPVSLLLASESSPLRITGQVEAVAKKRSYLWILSPKPRPTYIEIAPVQSFAYDDSDGSVDLWAAGKAGWFKIKPSPEYQPVYDDMVEAVRVMYFVVDAYQTPRKTGKGKNITTLPDYNPQELFQKYAVEVMGIEKGAPEAQKKMYKHRDFLMSNMLLEKEGIKWSRNPLCMHLINKFRDDWKKVKQRLHGNVAPDAAKQKTKEAPDRASHTRRASLESASTATSLKRKRGRPPKNPGPDIISIASTSVTDSPPLDASVTAIAKGASGTKSKAARSTRSNPEPSEPEIEDSQPTTPAVQDSDADLRRRRKSALRLKPDKAAKGPPKRDYVSNAVDDEEDELSQDHTIHPQPNGNKRKREQETHEKADKDRGSSKRTISNGRSHAKHTAETADEGIDIPPSPSSSPDDTIAGADAADLPSRKLHQADQLQEHVWNCALDGCTHKVYGPASAPQTQRLIREHYALHAYDDDARVQMVKRMAEPSLPTHHLVEKVRGYVGLELKRMEGTKVAGSRFPQSVRTKY